MAQTDHLNLQPTRAEPEAGYELLALLQDEESYRPMLEALDELAPGFPDWIVTSLFGGTYQRPGLELRDRQLLNLGALAAIGGVEPQLRGHITTSLRIQMSLKEIVECFVHLAPYIGVPRALAALRVTADVVRESGGTP
jgi:4-carboxymuconolactone decarboxylase